MPALRAVLFDYGHTLLNFAIAEDSMLGCYEEVRRLLEAEAYSELPAAAELVEGVSRRVGEMVMESYRKQELEELDVVDLFESALGAIGLKLPRDLVHRIAVTEHRAMVSGLVMTDENRAVLRQIRGMGLKIGLVSNAHFLPEMMREDLERLGIAEYIDDAVFSAESGVRKPHPAIFRKVLDALDVRPEEAVFVGDRLHDDIGGAKSLGMTTILTQEFRQEEVTEQTELPDLVVQRLPEILPLVERLAREPATA